jgi:hypothetical protein
MNKNKFTQTQAQHDRELKSWFIREQQMHLLGVLKIQDTHIGKYELGNVLLIHIEHQKTKKLFEKRKRDRKSVV